MKTKALLSILLFVVALSLTPFLANAQTAPAAVTGVLVEYPECEGDSCSFVQASCKWDAVTDAASYNYTVTEVETSTQIQSATVGTETLRVVFPITQERTYKCDVYATNSTGQSGGTGTHSLLCSADALIDDTPTPVPNTPTMLPTKPPIESPGAATNTAIIIGGIALVIVGGLALILL